jgi:hypothetical protein
VADKGKENSLNIEKWEEKRNQPGNCPFKVIVCCGRERRCSMELDASFVCAYCFSVNEIVVDGTGGLQQQYIEDCQVCCRPNRLHIVVEEDLHAASVVAEPE